MDRATEQALIDSLTAQSYKYLGSMSMATSSEDYYRKMNQQAYEQLMRQMQRYPGQPVFATAIGGTFVATPRPPAAEVVDDPKTTPKALPKPRVNNLKYWGLLLGLSVVSIFPAWGPVLYHWAVK